MPNALAALALEYVRASAKLTDVEDSAQQKRGRLRRDAERNRERVVDAARRLITERGLDISHDDIAREADVGVGTVYRRFATLDVLFQEIFEDRVNEVIELLAHAERLEDPWDGLRHFMVGNCELQSRHRGLQQFLLSHAGSLEYSRNARDRLTPGVIALLERARADGRVRPDVQASDVALIFALTGVMIDAARTVDPELWRRYLEMLLDGIKLGPRSATLPGSPPAGQELDQVLTRWGPAGRTR